MGKFDELDEAEQERRKKEEIAYRNKKRNSRMLVLFGSVFEVIETLFIIIVLFIGSAALFSRILSPEIFAKIYSFLTIAIFFGGLVLGFLIYRKLMQIVIEKFNLRDKLTDEVLSHYDKITREKLEEEMKK